jgi:hypothetical protein
LELIVTSSGRRDRSHSPKNSSARPYERAASTCRTPPAQAASSTACAVRSMPATLASPTSAPWPRLM